MHHDEQSRQQRGQKAKVQADAGRTNNQSNRESAERRGPNQPKLQRRELDVPATPRSGGGRTEPHRPDLGGERNREGVGNLVSGDKTLLESPERAAKPNRTVKRNNKKRKNRAA